MSEDEQSFVLVIEAEEARQHVAGWPEGALLAAKCREGLDADVALILDEDSLRKFVGNLAVVPHRKGFKSGLPPAGLEADMLLEAISQARSGDVERRFGATAPVIGSDPFEDIGADARFDQPPADEGDDAAQFWVRRHGRGIQIKSTGNALLPGQMEQVSVGSSMFGIAFSEQKLEQVTIIAVQTSDLGISAPMAGFLPRKWAKVRVVQGPSGLYFDVSTLLLQGIARRIRRATLAAIAGIAIGCGAAALAIAIYLEHGLHP